MMPRTEEDGFALIEFLVCLVFVILPTAAIGACAINWPGRVNAAHGAAYEATKTVLDTGDTAAGEGRAREVWANHGYTDEVSVTFEGDLSDRGGELTATVTITLPLLNLPTGTFGGQSYSTHHTARISDYGSQS